MRVVFTVLLAFILSAKLAAQEFAFQKETINFGKITKGADGKRVFEFTNIGTEPIVINRVASTCGCAVSEKREKPIMPGKKGKIVVSYNTNIVGNFTKAFTVYSNAKKGRKVLKIKGFISKG